MERISSVYLIFVSTVNFHVNMIIPIHYYCILTLCYQFYHHPFIALQPKLNHLLPVQPPPQQAHLKHLSPPHQPSFQPLCLTSSGMISTVVSAVVATASFSTSAVTKVAAASIPVPRALKESNNVPFSPSHLSPSTHLYPQPGSRTYESP